MFVYVKGLAILEERAYRITIDSDNNTHEVFYYDADSQYPPDYFVPVENTLLSKRALPVGFSWQLNNSDTTTESIDFSPLGTITAFKATVENNDSSATLVITLSGQITLEKFDE